MFKNITINLDGPICRCTKKEYPSWGIYVDNDGMTCMFIKCTECDIRLNIPNKSFMAHFNYSLEAGSKNNTKENAKILQLVKDE